VRHEARLALEWTRRGGRAIETDLPISCLGDLYRLPRWQPERGTGNLCASFGLDSRASSRPAARAWLRRGALTRPSALIVVLIPMKKGHSPLVRQWQTAQNSSREWKGKEGGDHESEHGNG
jgi:hypothetical protein